jgi:hypothetical protein
VEEGAFAGAGATYDGDTFTAHDINVNAVKHGNIEFALHKDFA